MYKIVESPQPTKNDHLENFTGELLTNTEIQVIMLLFSGMTQSEIARKNNRSRSTIRNHVTNACQKTGKNSTIQLIKWYVDSILSLEVGKTFDQMAIIE